MLSSLRFSQAKGLVLKIGILVSVSFIFSSNWLFRKHVKFIEAFSSDWSAPVPGGGRGTEYTIRLLVLTGREIIFDSVWIEKRAYKCYLGSGKTTLNSEPVHFGKNDTIRLRISVRNNSLPPESSVPRGADKKAVVRYLLGKKAFYLPVPEIKKINTPKLQ